MPVPAPAALAAWTKTVRIGLVVALVLFAASAAAPTHLLRLRGALLYGALGQAGHTHSWTVPPPMGSPLVLLGAGQTDSPRAGSLVRISAQPPSAGEHDTCANAGCSFANSLAFNVTALVDGSW